MGRLKTTEERLSKRMKPKEDDKKMTQKDWQAIQRDQRAKSIMDRLKGIPVKDAKDSLKAQKQQRVVTFGHHTAHQKKA